MNRYWYVAVAAVAVCCLLARWFAADTKPRPREEVAAIPGSVVFSEGTSAVTGLYDEARALLEKGDVARAEQVYHRIVAAEPDNAPGYAGVGGCRLWQGDLAGAEEQYRKALALEPRSGAALVGLAAVAFRRGQYEVAVGYYERARAMNESDADVHRGLAISHDALGNDERAARHYDRFLELAPTSGLANQVRTRLAELRKQAGQQP